MSSRFVSLRTAGGVLPHMTLRSAAAFIVGVLVVYICPDVAAVRRACRLAPRRADPDRLVETLI